MLTESKLAKRSALLKRLGWLDGRRDLKTLLLTRESLSEVKINGDITGCVPSIHLNASDDRSADNARDDTTRVKWSQVTLRHVAWKESEDEAAVSLFIDIHVTEARINGSHLLPLFSNPPNDSSESPVTLKLSVDHLHVNTAAIALIHGTLETIYKSCRALSSFRKPQSQNRTPSLHTHQNRLSLQILQVSFSNHAARVHNVSLSPRLEAGQTLSIQRFVSNEDPVIEANDIRISPLDQGTVHATIRSLDRYDFGGWKLAEPVSNVCFEWTEAMILVQMDETTLVETSTTSSNDNPGTQESSLHYHFALVSGSIVRPFHLKCRKIYFQVPSIESTMTWENVGLIVQKQEPVMGDGTLAQLSVGSLEVADILQFPQVFRIAGLWTFPTEWSLVQILCPQALIFVDKAKAKRFWDRLVQEMRNTDLGASWWHQLQTPNAVVSEVSVSYQLDASKSQKLSAHNVARKLVASTEVLEAFAADETSLAGLIGRYAAHIKMTTETRHQEMYRLHESTTDSAAAFLGRVAVGSGHPLVLVTASLAGLGVKDAVTSTIDMGKEKRGADRSERYVFGDFSRGMVSRLQSRRNSSRTTQEGDGPSDSCALLEGSSSSASSQESERDGIDDGTKSSSKRERYAGVAGSVVGSMAGMAVLGPVGMLAGSFAGGYSARAAASETPKVELEEQSVRKQSKDDGSSRDADVFERVSIVPPTTPDMDLCSTIEIEETPSIHHEASGSHEVASAARKPYRFGDISRGIITKGKAADGRGKDSSYKFGDFTRGLVSSWK